MNFLTNSRYALVGGIESFGTHSLNAAKALLFCLLIWMLGGNLALAQTDSSYSDLDSSSYYRLAGGGSDGNNGAADVAICHQLGNGGSITIYVNESAVPYHIAHGDYLGVCDDGDNFEVPCELALQVLCIPDVTVECGQENNFDLTGVPEISGEFCDQDLHLHFNDVILSEGACGKVISRTWIISLALMTEVCTQIITTQDTQGPEIIGFDEAVDVQCIDDAATLQDVLALDACGGDVAVESWSSQTGELESTCVATTALGPGSDWAIWLPTLSSASGANFVFGAEAGHFDQFADGSAHLYGTVQNSLNANEQFIVDLWLANKANWSAWSALGRNYKNDLLLDCATNNHQNWSYYELIGGFSTLSGAGTLAGTELYIYHAPASFYFGFQLGVGANNRNCENGMSGWFTYNGYMGGQAINGHGDVNVNLQCEPNLEQDCVHHTSFTRFFRAEDACGNVTVASQQVNVNDTTAPVFSNCPQSFTTECSTNEIPVAQNIEAIDNCSGDVSVDYLGETAEVGPCFTTITRTWSATDICGNRSECAQIITIVDTTAPELANLPAAEISSECDAVPAAAVVAIADNCDQNPVLIFHEERIDGNCPSNYTLVRSWYGYDQCENTSDTFTQIIHVQDTTAPVFDAFEVYAHVLCNEIPASITASDNCGQATVEIVSEVLQSGGCLGTIHRIYRATDECGNTSETEQFIAILDTTAPELAGLPEDLTLECSDVILNDDAGVYGIDNCENEVSITYTEIYVGRDDDCPETYDILRTWVATDACDNQTSASRTTHVQDTTAPVFVSFPADLTISCDDEIPAVVYPTVVDNCDTEVDVELGIATMPGLCPQNYFIHRTFRGHDNCGNEIVETQTITVVDSEAPLFAVQNNEFTYECNTDIPVIAPAASDNCGQVSLDYSDSDSEGNPCYYTINRVWTATDECGNVSQLTQFIHIQDTTAPVISGDNQIDRPCDDYAGTFVTVSDNCNQYTVDYTEELVSGSCAGNVIRRYVATDNCGNVSEEFIQVIHLNDTVAPVVISQTNDMNVECGEAYDVNPAQFTDNCDQELEINSDFSSENDGCITVETYSWTATDHCGNTTTVSTVVTIVDTTNPSFTSLPQNTTINCDEEVPGFGVYTAVDNCDSQVEIEVEEHLLSGDCPQSYTLERVYRASDDCGNQLVETRYVYVIDQSAPYFGDQNNQFSYECGQSIPVIEPTAFDNCGEVSLDFQDSALEGSDCQRMITRNWTATDECGNTSFFNQYITIVDTQAPVVNPYTIEVEMPCDGVSSEIMISAVDCNEVNITFNDEYVSGGCAGRIIRTYSVSDVCGNQTQGLIQQIINLIDTTAPTVEHAPGDIDIECGESIPAYEPIWADNCAEELTLSAASSISVDECSTVITEIWTAEDPCGNSSSVSRTITITDSTAPVFTSVPENQNRDCSVNDVIAPAYAEDVCSDVTITHSDVIVSGFCPASYTIERTYTATDACGNSASYTQYINVSDNSGPMWGTNQTTFVYECGSNVEIVTPVASDDCSEYTVAYVDGNLIESGCTGAFERVWTAVDACGNASQPFVQYISFIDTTEPALNGCPSDLVLNCNDEIPAPAQVSATDGCDSDVQVYYEEHILGNAPAEGSIADCNLLTPIRTPGATCGYPYDWAMAMYGMPSAHRWYQVAGGSLVQYPDGSMHLQAQLENVLTPGTGWNADIWFNGGMDWAAWSTQDFPTSFKADCGGVAANFASWAYFLLQSSPGAELTGYGNYAGSAVNMVHAPSNNYFGFQLGDGANNYNDVDNAFGGWFSYSGAFSSNGGQSFSNVIGAGDLAFELDCCPEYTIERQWMAVDCSGNTSMCAQSISFSPNVASTGNSGQTTLFDDASSNERLSSSIVVSPNPANNSTLFTFKAAYTAKTSLEVRDMTGKKVADVFIGTVESGASYNVNFNVSDLATGVYTYRLTNGSDVKIDRLIINR